MGRTSRSRQLVLGVDEPDFGALLDPPSEDVTAHVVEMLARLGYTTSHPTLARGLSYLRRTQRADGSWFGRWGVNFIYGTWCAVAALAQVRTTTPEVQRMIDAAAGWMLEKQNRDGGWGETCESYDRAELAGRGESIPSRGRSAALSARARQLTP